MGGGGTSGVSADEGRMGIAEDVGTGEECIGVSSRNEGTGLSSQADSSLEACSNRMESSQEEVRETETIKTTPQS